MKLISYSLMIIIVLLGITFAIINADSVTLHYFIGSHSLPLSVLIVLSLFVGVLLGFSVSFIATLKQKKINFQLRQRVKLAEKEVNNLRNIPLKDEH